MKPLVPLRTILLCRFKQLPAETARDVEMVVASDPAVREQWKAIDRIDRERPRSLPRLDPATVARYVDGTLADEQRQRFEQLCWTHEELLAEIIDVFDAHFGEHPGAHGDPPPSSDLNLRLQRLWTTSGDAKRTAASPPTVTQETNEQGLLNGKAPSDRAPTQTPPARASISRGERFTIQTGRISDRRAPHRTRARAIRWLTVLASCAALALLALWWWRPERQSETRSDVVHQGYSQRLGSRSTNAAQHHSVRGAPRTPQKHAIAADDQSVAEIHNGDFAVRLPSESAIELAGSFLDSQPPRDLAPSEVEPLNQPALPSPWPEIDWRRVEGAVAIRSVADPRWIGPGKLGTGQSIAAIHVFPGSRATFALKNCVTLGLADDAHVRLELAWSERQDNADAADTTPEASTASPTRHLRVSLDHGFLLVTDLDKSVMLTLQFADSACVVEANSVETQIAFDWKRGSLRAAVVRGWARFDDTSVTSGQQISFGVNGERHVEMSSQRRPEPEGRRTNFRWSQVARERLWNSDDVESELKSLASAANAQQRTAAAFWLASIDTESEMLASLASDDARIRGQVSQWLVNQPVDSPRSMAIWRLVAERSTPQLARAWANTARANQQGSALNPADLEVILSGLESPDLFARELSFRLLEARFGNSPGYHPDADPASRDAARRLWRMQIRQLNR